ncbi:MAG: tripartite tricarboxylate transporter substrate binding protein [Betaproteobacteria bacterium]|nr:tripartite tricarboxylate transporter substrate binding protein [Betaproteobacteria bacterium]MBU6511860.1 tripartite tricarboxylate transporter substrate binding protein [Betaproteobacteria bacterium]MDE1954911.1 tripartite tricarboxylate transporter substrate binding protein [Betaproteobacteria bacterium]MDE2152600.1 tripartite tricarboxylate transporter substrate binding protein [Betaproteobacteria bacterium]MDE2478024.1 tripartite tricarboxylate transporter substrate binding protein [Bet
MLHSSTRGSEAPRASWTGRLRKAACALGLAAALPLAHAAYPDHPINFIVPWGAGGGADLLARTSSKIMEKQLGVSLPVINVPGADGVVGMTKLLTSPADGYNVAVLIGDTFALLSGKNPPFKLNQIIPLAIMIQQPSGYWVNAKGPLKTWQDVENAAKKKTLTVAVTGFGSADDITTRYLAHKLGIKLESVPFAKPGQRYSSILGGNADIVYEQTGDVRSYFDSGKFRPVLFFYPKPVPIPAFEKVPVSGQLGLDVTLPQFRAIVVKAGTPPDRVKKLADALAKVAQTPEFKAYLNQQYADPNSYVPMQNADAFMAGWLRQAEHTIEISK